MYLLAARDNEIQLLLPSIWFLLCFSKSIWQTPTHCFLSYVLTLKLCAIYVRNVTLLKEAKQFRSSVMPKHSTLLLFPIINSVMISHARSCALLHLRAFCAQMFLISAGAWGLIYSVRGKLNQRGCDLLSRSKNKTTLPPSLVAQG